MVTRTIPISRQIQRPAPRPAPRPTHKAAPPPSNNSQYLVGGGIAVVVLIVLVLMYAFGASGIVTGYRPQAVEAPPPVAPVSHTTTFYRDLKNGRVMIMEIDDKGTRVLGTKAKEDVQITNDSYNDPRKRDANTIDRLNAFSETFK